MMSRAIVICVVAGVLQTAGEIDAETWSRVKLTEAINSVDANMQGVEITYRVRVENIDPALAPPDTLRIAFDDTSSRFVVGFQGRKVRWEAQTFFALNDKRTPVKKVVAYDGEKTTALEGTPLISSDGTLSTYTYGEVTGDYPNTVFADVREWGILHYGQSLSDYFRSGATEVEGEEVIDGKICQRVSVASNQMNMMVWIEPSSGFRMHRLESRKGNSITRMQVSGFGESKGFWYPLSGTWEVSIDNKTLQRRSLSVEHVTVGIDFPETYFEVAFPKGTYVQDLRNGKTFEVR